ncbi:MAG: hypothetical protein J5745_01795 [Bacteroidales bacterium]|nr:hypothetical protein [Bacteroidales bacterium]
MKKLIYIAAAFAVLACSGTQDNDPWGKIDEDRAKEAAEDKANEGKVLELSMSSSIMKQTMTYSVWLPREYDENREYPFLYLLHGYEYGDQSRLDRCWLDKGNAATIADKYQKDGGVAMIIVMPNGLSSFYQGDYENYFHKELMPKVEADLKCNGKRAIAGLSMGGYGTLYHALTYPEKFTYAYAMSPAANAWMASGVNSNNVSIYPAFTIEVGTEDHTVNNEDARSLYKTMTGKGISCQWIERAGTHDWKFWQECLPKTLDAVGKSFNK